MKVAIWLVAVGALVLSAADAAAQTAQQISIQVSGIYASLFGDAYEGVDNGIGGEAQLRFTPSAFSIGAGGQYTRHGVEGLDEDLSLMGVFLEPRFVIPVGSNYFAPYVSGRLSLLRQSISVDANSGFCVGKLSGSTTGVTANGGGGLLVRLGSRLNLDAGATYGYTRFGEGTIRCESTGDRLEFPSGNGSNVIVRVGLAIGLGG